MYLARAYTILVVLVQNVSSFYFHIGLSYKVERPCEIGRQRKFAKLVAKNVATLVVQPVDQLAEKI